MKVLVNKTTGLIRGVFADDEVVVIAGENTVIPGQQLIIGDCNFLNSIIYSNVNGVSSDLVNKATYNGVRVVGKRDNTMIIPARRLS